MGSIIYIGGAKGVGKTTLLSTMKDRINYLICNPGTRMLEQALLRHPDDMDKIGIKERRDARMRVFKGIFEEHNSQNVIFDGHFSIPNMFGYEWGLPFEFALNINIYVLITLKPELLLRRRSQDRYRQRGPLLIDKVKLDLKIERIYATYYSKLHCRPLHIINNTEIEQSRQKLLDIIPHESYTPITQ